MQVLPQDNVSLRFLLQATGDISNSDIDLAVASKAIVIGFNVRAPGSVKSYADSRGVEIRLYRVIYDLIDDVRNAMEGLLDAVEVKLTQICYFLLGISCGLLSVWTNFCRNLCSILCTNLTRDFLRVLDCMLATSYSYIFLHLFNL